MTLGGRGVPRRTATSSSCDEPARLGAAQSVSLRLHVLASTRAEDIAEPVRHGGALDAGSAGDVQAARAGRDAARARATWSGSFAGRSRARGGARACGSRSTSTDVPAGAPVFIVDVARHPSVPPAKRTWREPRSIWNQAWFSTQRCANGLLRYARQIASRGPRGSSPPDDRDRARRAADATASSPPCSSRRTSGGLALVELEPAAAVRLRAGLPPRRRRLHVPDAARVARAHRGRARARAYVRTVRRAPRLAPAPERRVSRMGGARRTRPDRARGGPRVGRLGRAPLRARRRPELARCRAPRRVVPRGRRRARGAGKTSRRTTRARRWGAPEQLGRRVARNGVYKQNTLSISWCAEAFLHAWRATRRPRVSAARAPLHRRALALPGGVGPALPAGPRPRRLRRDERRLRVERRPAEPLRAALPRARDARPGTASSSSAA